MSKFDLLTQIGNTPLVKIKRLNQNPRVTILAKLEWFNPGGSVKDRAAYHMISSGEKSGALTHEKTILDATSGNTGIAYAMIGALKGYRVQLVVPKNICHERRHMTAAYGAELIFSDPREGSDGAIRKCLEIYHASPDRYFFPDQYNNDENWKAHYQTTGPEIWKQTDGQMTHFVAGLGTSGTFMGTGRFLREKNKNIRLVQVQPDAPFHGLEGWKHMKTAIKPGFYREDFADETIEVSTEESHRTTKLLAKKEGLFAGVSPGGAMAAALKLAQKLSSGTIVVIFADGGDRYMNEKFWEVEE
ncbi:MAG: cysteine synthase [Candidatus Omnitrophica bacterium CG11_big_fil_rev_8_21_14_0_20_45_26]|uniref:cysteine synthase n=1 Tax=Candidatus Abzuiibacterium crystallinum TaxID=1974748 RepID=A0A2H0LMS9_9BACT|nr:MAG: cysteine synthase [Candidatus Omnitrophica bacterium CG11_big_fil_rev_8_21_14_0_20_45_26]PIW64137.1 MAG: cysteine synthase [Candidatus Omnitrophica bacterium CG12_big_fil_rev_8_21_14_0_65_45_16]